MILAASKPTSYSENALAHETWINDITVRLICILALDRFGDFVSDQVVAPVRETCGQALGALLQHMSPKAVPRVQQVLLTLAQHKTWEVRHGGLLGMKYVMAVRKDLVDILLPPAFSIVKNGYALWMSRKSSPGVLSPTFRLCDLDDDVRAVSAETLLPIAEEMAALLEADMPSLLQTLWNTLLNLDDLTASTALVMDLLAKLYTNPRIQQMHVAESDLGQAYRLQVVVPRLWPFFRHSLASVRTAVLRTIHTLLQLDNVTEWVPYVIEPMARLGYQNLLLEDRPVCRIPSTLSIHAH